MDSRKIRIKSQLRFNRVRINRVRPVIQSSYLKRVLPSFSISDTDADTDWSFQHLEIDLPKVCQLFITKIVRHHYFSWLIK